ncbi:MAG: FHA domain-containing protein, partial [Gemmatimonadales bacterium]
MKVQIKILTGSRAGAQFVFSRPKITIGRHPSSDVQFEPKTDLDVSTRHAVLLSASGKWRIRDLQSLNGTLVNGHTISGDTRLDDTDQIKFGANGPSIEFRLVPDSVPDSVSPPPAPQVEKARATADPLRRAPVAAGSAQGMSTTQRISIEVAKHTKGFRTVVVVLFATLLVTIAAFYFIDLSRKRARTAEIIAEQTRVDSILEASGQTVRALQGQMAGLTESLQDSRSDVSRLSRALTAANESGTDEQIALLRQQLNNASEALRSQQVAAQI